MNRLNGFSFDKYSSDFISEIVNRQLKSGYIASSIMTSTVSEYHINSIEANNPIEDRFAVTINESGAYFAVIDGHAGVGAANYVRDKLFSYIQDSIKRKLKASNGDRPTKCIMEGLDEAFQRLDKDFLVTGLTDDLKLPDVYSGACVATACFLGGQLFIANCGDCRAVLGRKRSYGVHGCEALALTRDHTAIDEEDRLRREHPNEQDIVTNGLIKGNLEPSRAIGDALFKDPIFNTYLKETYRMKEPWTPPYVTSKPDVFVHKIDPNDSFIIMATDGLWDRFTIQEVVDIVGQHDRRSKENICTLLLKKALERAIKNNFTPEEKMSCALQLPAQIRRKYYDDITVIVIYLDREKLGKTCSYYRASSDLFAPNPFHLSTVREEMLSESFGEAPSYFQS